MKIKTIDTFGVERDYDSLEEARDELDDEYLSCFDSEELSDSLLRMLDCINNILDGYTSVERYTEDDGTVVIEG